MAETFTDNVLLYLQVLINKVGTVNAVGHDTAHKSSGQKYILRLFFVEKTADSHTIQQIQLFMRASDQVGISFVLQILPDSRPHQSVMSCYIYFSILFHD